MREFLVSILVVSLIAACSKPLTDVVYVTESFNVSGNCDMCKDKIEKSVHLSGVKNAVWSKQTHILTIQYAPSKIAIGTIHQKIADAGYDTDKVRADDKVYSKLHSCCKYERKHE